MAQDSSLKSILLLIILSAVVTLYGCCKEFQVPKFQRNHLSESGDKLLSFPTNTLRYEGDRLNIPGE